jgi:hypothetical protein
MIKLRSAEMTKIEAIQKYLRASRKLSDSIEYDQNGRTVFQSRGLLGAETRAFRQAKALCENDQEFINLCQEMRIK